MNTERVKELLGESANSINSESGLKKALFDYDDGRRDEEKKHFAYDILSEVMQTEDIYSLEEAKRTVEKYYDLCDTSYRSIFVIVIAAIYNNPGKIGEILKTGVSLSPIAKGLEYHKKITKYREYGRLVESIWYETAVKEFADSLIEHVQKRADDEIDRIAIEKIAKFSNISKRLTLRRARNTIHEALGIYALDTLKGYDEERLFVALCLTMEEGFFEDKKLVDAIKAASIKAEETSEKCQESLKTQNSESLRDAVIDSVYRRIAIVFDVYADREIEDIIDKIIKHEGVTVTNENRYEAANNILMKKSERELLSIIEQSEDESRIPPSVRKYQESLKKQSDDSLNDKAKGDRN